MTLTVSLLYSDDFDEHYHIDRIIRTLHPGSKYWGLLGHLETYEEKYKTLKEHWAELRKKGAEMHNYIAHYFDSTKTKPDQNFVKKMEREIAQFHHFLNKENYEPFHIEKIIENKSDGMSGRPDAVFMTSDEPKKYVLVDWTTSSNAHKDGGLQNVKSTDFLNSYKKILNNHNIIIDEMYMVVFRADLGDYEKIPIKDKNMEKQQTKDKEIKISVAPIENTNMEVDEQIEDEKCNVNRCTRIIKEKSNLENLLAMLNKISETAWKK